MKITNRVPKELRGPAGVILAVIVVAFIALSLIDDETTGPLDNLRRSLLKTGFLAVLLTIGGRLAFAAAGWQAWALAGAAFVLSGAAKDVASAIGAATGGNGGSSTNNLADQAAAACAAHGGLGGVGFMTSPTRRAFCKDGTVVSF